MSPGIPYTDAVLTTREVIWMIKSYGIDYWNFPEMEFWNMPKDDFDSPMGIASGAADIFGTTGGVMEATLRTAAEKVTGSPPKNLSLPKFVRSRDCARQRFSWVTKNCVLRWPMGLTTPVPSLIK